MSAEEAGAENGGMEGEQLSASLTVDEPPVPETVRAVVVMPAYNAASTLERTVCDLPADGVEEVILVERIGDTVPVLTIIPVQHGREYASVG